MASQFGLGAAAATSGRQRNVPAVHLCPPLSLVGISLAQSAETVFPRTRTDGALAPNPSFVIVRERYPNNHGGVGECCSEEKLNFNPRLSP